MGVFYEFMINLYSLSNSLTPPLSSKNVKKHFETPKLPPYTIQNFFPKSTFKSYTILEPYTFPNLHQKSLTPMIAWLWFARSVFLLIEFFSNHSHTHTLRVRFLYYNRERNYVQKRLFQSESGWCLSISEHGCVPRRIRVSDRHGQSVRFSLSKFFVIALPLFQFISFSYYKSNLFECPSVQII